MLGIFMSPEPQTNVTEKSSWTRSTVEFKQKLVGTELQMLDRLYNVSKHFYVSEGEKRLSYVIFLFRLNHSFFSSIIQPWIDCTLQGQQT